MSMGERLPRREAIPVLYTRGTHYQVGFDMGRTFASMIKNFLVLCNPMNDVFLPLYNTEKGKLAYNDTLEAVKKSFPQYIREMEGIADGAEVEFHKIFLLHMDDIMPQSLKHQNALKSKCKCNEEPTGCTSIIANTKCRIIGHTEDALSETLNHYYFVVAHIINPEPQGKYNVKEEHFMSLCYAGHLPGYTMSYNHHGLVFSINTISAEVLRSGKTPRHLITRALLSAENYSQAIKILKDTGVGAADACSVNMGFINDKTEMCYNIEIGPAPLDKNESIVNIKEVPVGSYNCHTNRFDRIKLDQANVFLMDSSNARSNTLGTYKPPETSDDVASMLGDCSGGEHCVWRDNNDVNQLVKTIAAGIFDLKAKTFSLYSNNPAFTRPHVVLPLMLK